MQTLLVFGVLPAVVLGLAAFLGTEPLVRRLRPHWPRRCARMTQTLGCVVLSLALLPVFSLRFDRGAWFCPVCAEIEEHTSYFGVRIEAREARVGPHVESAREYAGWLQALGPIDHEHSWIRLGCHWVGGRIVCSRRVIDYLFHASLPRVPDLDLARGFVLRLARASGPERWTLLRDFEQDGKQLFLRLVRHEPLTREAFSSELETWLAGHPLWR